MKDKNKRTGPVPERFDSYEEAAAFWDSHDTTKCPGLMTIVTVTSKLRKRHLEVEVDEQLVEALQKRAARAKKPVNQLVRELLRKKLSTAS